jgi:outer membrane murein-binding lipoprotein Lpp
MVKRFSILAMAGLIALPTFAVAGGTSSPADLERKIDELSRQLDELKAQMAKQNETVTEYGDKVDDMDELLEERSEAWDLASRFQFSGDFRARGDYYSANNVFAAGTPLFAGFDNSGNPTFEPAGGDQENDTIMTNRFRLNMRVKATENMEFKGRLAMYKAWGMQSTPTDLADGYPIFDGNTTRTPNDSALYVDRAFVNWNNIGELPIWFSIGRRPTTDGPPAQLRMGTDSRMATPPAYMDYPFDGLSLGYAYDWGIEALGSGRVRFCYGRGFENGLQYDQGTLLTDDTDFAGFSWDVMKKGDRFLNIQTFGVYNLYNYPAFTSDFVRYGASQSPNDGGYGAQTDLGQMYHTTGIYMSKVNDLNYFLAGGWSHTDPNGNGMFNDPLSGFNNTSSEDGYSVYAGVRYDMDDMGLKIGAEYNYGSQYWVAFTPGHDDLYMSKLGTRGNAYELYMIYDLPTGEAISKFAKTFVRLGWQYYDFNYSGGSDFNLKPYDLDEDKLALQALGLNPVESANQVYLTFEAYF